MEQVGAKTVEEEEEEEEEEREVVHGVLLSSFSIHAPAESGSPVVEGWHSSSDATPIVSNEGRGDGGEDVSEDRSGPRI